MIDEEQRQRFADLGLLRLEKVIPETTLAALRDRAFRAVERAGHWADGRWVGDPLPMFENSVSKRVKESLKNAETMRLLVTAEILAVVDDLVDGRVTRALTERPQALFTAPTLGEWTVPHSVWHLDVPRLGSLGLPGIQMFALLERVAPRAGGTLVVAGSHKLLNDRGTIRSKDVKKRLKREAYFADLFRGGQEGRQHFLDDVGHVGEVDLRVVELHGEAGDVFLTDLRLLHTVSPNASRTPRLMATQRFFLEEALDLQANVDAEKAPPTRTTSTATQRQCGALAS